MKKTISLSLVLSILNICCANISLKLAETNVNPKRKGADLLIRKTDGEQIRGELISVNQTSVLILERESGTDATIDVEHIEAITIVKKSRSGMGIGLGFLIGGGIGATYGYIGTKYIDVEWRGSYGLAALFFGGIGAGIGLIIGWIIGAVAGTDTTIQIEGKPYAEIHAIMQKLCNRARIRDSE